MGRDLIKNTIHTHMSHVPVGDSSEFMGKMFQAAQLTHEIFLTIDLPNLTYSTTHQRSVEVQFGRYKKKRSKISHVLVVPLETFSP